MTAQEAWDQYAKICLEGVDSDSSQYRVLKQTFYAGIVVSHIEMHRIAKVSDDERGATQLEDFFDEVKHEVSLMAGL